MKKPTKDGLTALVLQGGGALGAYQAGVYEVLSKNSHRPDWLAGISIGAINGAIIAGNPAEIRLKRLREFWELVTSGLMEQPLSQIAGSRWFNDETAAALAVLAGIPGFFQPRFPPAWLMPSGSPDALSYYDTSPLLETLTDLVDFDFLNERGPRLSVGAVDIETGNFAYFDSSEMAIGPEHVMASGALPPGFPPVSVHGHSYWDGGLVSNTPLQYVLENSGQQPICIFQVDLFSARGQRPSNLIEAAQREKDIRYSSRTRLTTDRFRELARVRAAANRLSEKLPEDMRDDADLAFLRSVGPGGHVTLVHLIHRKEDFESNSKDYEFSRRSMTDHWAAGTKDALATLRHHEWQGPGEDPDGIRIFDLGNLDD